MSTPLATGWDELGALVPTTQRGPIGGVSTFNVAAGSWIVPGGPDGTLEQQWTVTGDITVDSISDGVDGQPILLWFYASGADRKVTFAAGFETTQPVPGRVLTIPAGTWGSVLARLRGSTWVLMAAYPQPVGAGVVVSGPSGGTITLDASAGSVFAHTASSPVTLAPPSNPGDGQRLLIEVMGNTSTSRTVTPASGTTTMLTGLPTSLTATSSRVVLVGMYYSVRAGHWLVTAFNSE